MVYTKMALRSTRSMAVFYTYQLLPRAAVTRNAWY